jgi:cytochrome c
LTRNLLAGTFLAALAWNAPAQDSLISGPGATLTESKCKVCHELEHIRRARLSPDEWADNIKNMRERGAPLTDAEVQIIHRYLSTYYNRDKPAPAPGPDTLAAGGDDPVQKLLNAHACLGCHAMDSRVVGPSFAEVAKKYAGDAGAAPALAAKIRNGGRGVWGQVPMPPNPAVPEDHLKTIVDWILAQK